MTQLLVIALLALWFRYPHAGLAMFATYIAYAKPEYLPIVAIIALYGMYKILVILAKGISNENSIKH